MRKGMLFTSFVAAIALASAACGGTSSTTGTTTPTQRPLYDRIGGMDAIKLVVEQFVANVLADTRINAFFIDKADPARLKEKLVEQICAASGGPCKYTGKNMREAHAGMGVTDADFTALVEDLIAALKQYNVPQPEQDELLTKLGALKPEIVGV